MNDDIRIAIEVVGDRIETQNGILAEKLNSLSNLDYLGEISDNLKGIYEELNEIKHILKDSSNK